MTEEEISERAERARRNHESGCNCAQSVLCAYSDRLGVGESTLFKISEGFGLGMGRMETCGAVAAAFMAAGIVKSCGDSAGENTKPATMQAVKKLGDAFEQKNGSLICKDLKGISTGKPLRSCSGCIEDAVRLIGEELF